MELHLGRKLLFSPLLKELCQKQKIVLIADTRLKDLYASALARHLNADLFLISNQKNEKVLISLLKQLLAKSYGKDTIFLALGGGSITDLVGFAASIFLRGVPLILLPTTLLAICDAAIGSKTGIDTPFGKNLIGSFYEPKAVVADLDTLDSLPEEERTQGEVEIIKMGLIHDPSILENLDIQKAIDAKRFIVSKDPKDQGLRRILNFGHTIGHALETASEVSHGKAIAWGLVLESLLSVQMGYLSPSDFELIHKLLKPFLKEEVKKRFRKEVFWQSLMRDKKRAGGDVRSVLLDQIGRAANFDGNYCTRITLTQIEKAFSFFYDYDPSI